MQKDCKQMSRYEVLLAGLYVVAQVSVMLNHTSRYLGVPVATWADALRGLGCCTT